MFRQKQSGCYSSGDWLRWHFPERENHSTLAGVVKGICGVSFSEVLQSKAKNLGKRVG